jgi:hypothetical protein
MAIARCLVDKTFAEVRVRRTEKYRRSERAGFIVSGHPRPQTAELRELGYSDNDIALMIPTVVDKIFRTKIETSASGLLSV